MSIWLNKFRKNGTTFHARQKAELILTLRKSGVTDRATLAALEEIPREFFTPSAFQEQAYEDMTLPIGHGQTLSMPSVVARMTEALNLKSVTRVLEIGTGSGYQAAVLSKICAHVYSIERHEPLLRIAEQRFIKLGLNNIYTRYGDGNLGWPEQPAFERIILTAAAPELPWGLIRHLAEGGLMVLPVGPERGRQRLIRIERRGDSVYPEDLGPTQFVPLREGIPLDQEEEEQTKLSQNSLNFMKKLKYKIQKR